MNKFWLVKWILLCLHMTAVQAQNAQNIDSTEQSLQAVVEASLLLPVSFEGEQPTRFSVEERLAHHKVPGISFALIKKGKVAWTQGYGRIAATSDEAVTPQTVFQAASIAKPVTAFGVMRMQDGNAININHNINKYLKTVALATGKQTAESYVTFKNLLDHTSGLTGGGYLGYLRGKEIPSDVQTISGVAPATSPPSKVERLPGTKVLYSGAGYTLIEIALSDAFNQPFANIMDKWVLSAVGMENSSFELDYPITERLQVALGHDSQGKTIEGGWRVHPEQAAAGLWSTSTDLAKLAIETSRSYQGQSKLLSQASARELLAPVMPDQDLSAEFGGQPAMTFVVAGEGEDFVFQHGGANIGYRSLMVMYPESGDGAVFMTNSDAGFGVGLEMIRAASAVYGWPGFKPKVLVRREASNDEQADYFGEYQFDAGWKVDIIRVAQADGIAVKFPNGDVYPLTTIEGENSYVHQDTGVVATFSKDDGETLLHLYNQVAHKK